MSILAGSRRNQGLPHVPINIQISAARTVDDAQLPRSTGMRDVVKRLLENETAHSTLLQEESRQLVLPTFEREPQLTQAVSTVTQVPSLSVSSIVHITGGTQVYPQDWLLFWEGEGFDESMTLFRSNVCDPWARQHAWKWSTPQEASTTRLPAREQDATQSIRELIDVLLHSANDDDSTSEVESAEKIEKTLRRSTFSLVHAFRELLAARSEPEVDISTFLRLLGRHVSANRTRLIRTLLVEALESDSAVIRHGAAIGLANIGDSTSIAYLAHAMKNEPSDRLREIIGSVITA